ncbi:MAG TPA: bifunctional homocysteine S-methyltransferase/methylenetetrahydrofolate reductase [Anaerolineales bacterium]|nr:bifunctional homocysteine S-methyltransferase/methylenetetrahydrofolate reductase [Anaerolineales bacterium]
MSETAEKTALSALLAADRPLLMDGAMGTMLHERGVGFDECFDELNLTRPAVVAEVHRAYLDAGAGSLLTNTFGANRYRLARHGLEDRVDEINRAGVELARRVILASFREVHLVGDIGPLGVRLAPFGRVQLEQAREAFTEQVEALAGAGVDFLLFETFTDLYEIIEGVRAAREVAPGTGVVASMTFTRDDRTVLGNSPEEIARTLQNEGVDVIGINCSGGPAQMLRILRRMRAAVPEAHFLVKPNAGLPEQVGGRILYPAGPAYFADYAQAFRQAGARLIGGCCGTTPQHIAAMKQGLAAPDIHFEAETEPAEVEAENGASLEGDAPTGLSRKLASGTFVRTVELSPPRGLGMEKLLAAAAMLMEAGADCVDIADSPMARMRMSPWAVSNIVQGRLGLETVLHFPTRGRNLLRVQGDLLAAHALDVRNIFVVMGDPTAIGDYPDAMDDYDVVPSGVVKLIKQNFNLGIDYAGAEIGKPTSFFAGCALDLTPRDSGREIKTLRRKVESGADFALTQPVFEPAQAEEFVRRYEDEVGRLELPLIVGILPLFNERHATFLHNELPGVHIPEGILKRMENAADKRQEGIRIAGELIEAVRPWAAGVYLIPPFRRYDVAAEIVEAT